MTALITSDKDVKRFYSKIIFGQGDQCWDWNGDTGRGGYGRFWIGGKTRMATHVSWELRHKMPFPDGMQGLHTCDTPSCVNPAHIFPGSVHDNMFDAREKKRLTGQKKTHCLRGHPLSGSNLKVATVYGHGQRRCKACDVIRQRTYREAARGK